MCFQILSLMCPSVEAGSVQKSPFALAIMLSAILVQGTRRISMLQKIRVTYRPSSV